MTTSLERPRRRTFVGSLALAAATPPWLLTACANIPTATPGRTASAGRSAAQDYQLANRISWGANDTELARVRQLGAAAYIEQQIRPKADAGLPASVQSRIDAQRIQQTPLPTLVADIEASHKRGESLPTEDERKAAQQAYQQDLTRVAQQAANRHLLRALYSTNQLQEQMTWFWFNHFNIHQYKSNLRAMLGDYEERAIRPHALGSFRALLGAVAHHPAMLRYLDNEQNAAGRPNENYARELLELHTLGVDGGYSQRDVQELARVLSGHGLNLTDKTPALKPDRAALYVRDGLYEFNPARHDFGDKSLLGMTVRGRGGAELDEVLDLLAVHPATARFVSRKIARQLLADEPPARLIDEMSTAWTRHKGQLAPVMSVLLHAPEFSAPGPTKFKDPMHFVVSAVRACYGDRPVLSTMPMQNWLNRLAEGLYNRQTPDGYPSNAASWSSSGQMATRFDIARALGSGSAGLFRPEEVSVSVAMAPSTAASASAVTLTPPKELPAFPQLARPIYYETLRPLLAAPTREALDTAASPQDWNSLYLSSPEFMYC